MEINRGKANLISIVVPCYNEEPVLPLLCEELSLFANTHQDEYETEVILVDDGSHDATWKSICKHISADPRFRGIRLSRNFGHQAALTCGYSFAVGDAVVCLDADLQDPPQVIQLMVEQWREGSDVVYAVRSDREGESWAKLASAKVFYRILGAMCATPMQYDAGDFRLLSRQALRALLSLPEQHRYLRGMVAWIGFRTSVVYYKRRQRVAGRTKYPWSKMLAFAVDAIISFSRVPLRFAYYCALLLACVFLGYLAYALIMFVFLDVELVRGWSSLIVAIVAFGVANLTCLAILGEYVGRIYEQVKQRPVYLIQEQFVNTETSRANRLMSEIQNH